MAGKYLNSAIPIRVTAILIRNTSEAQLLFSQSLREAIRHSVSWALGAKLHDLQPGFVPEGPQRKQPRLLEEMRQRFDASSQQAVSALLQNDQSDADAVKFWMQAGQKLAKKIGTQASRLVERRLIYAVSMSVKEAVAQYRPGEELHGTLKDSEDLYVIAVNMSADIAAILYPLQAYTGWCGHETH